MIRDGVGLEPLCEVIHGHTYEPIPLLSEWQRSGNIHSYSFLGRTHTTAEGNTLASSVPSWSNIRRKFGPIPGRPDSCHPIEPMLQLTQCLLPSHMSARDLIMGFFEQLRSHLSRYHQLLILIEAIGCHPPPLKQLIVQTKKVPLIPIALSFSTER